MPVLPKPMMYRIHDGAYTLPSSVIGIYCDCFKSDCYTVFLERINRNHFHATVNECHILVNKKPMINNEEYILKINERGIAVEASSDTGVIRALTTLYQLMDERSNVPFCHIHDKPRYPHRSLSLDCARQFFSVADVKNIIEQMSRVKMNTLHWHLSDDQAWRIESKRYPNLHRLYGGEIYTQADIAVRRCGTGMEPQI